MDHVLLARSHGWFNTVGGAWPLLHMRSFERVFGPKTDRWLVRAVAGLMLTNGVTQILAEPSVSALRQARRIGLGTALTLGLIDLVYAPPGRISRVYLLDAVLEIGWVAAWLAASRPSEQPARWRCTWQRAAA